MADSRIILAGQSNALGYLNTGAAPYVPTPRVQIWADTNGDGVPDAWNYMNPGVNTGTPENPTVWGPEVGFANSWLATHPTGNLWIVKIAKGSTGLAADPAQIDWSPSSSGEMYAQATAAIAAARANLAGSSYAFATWDGALWMRTTTATSPTFCMTLGPIGTSPTSWSGASETAPRCPIRCTSATPSGATTRPIRPWCRSRLSASHCNPTACTTTPTGS